MAPPTALATRPPGLVDSVISPKAKETERVQPSRPTEFEMASAVVLETGCTQQRAEAFAKMCQTAVAKCDHRGIYQLTPSDLSLHGVFVKVMPDGKRARPGSAHDIINRGVGATLIHGRTGRDQCIITIEVNV